MTQYEIAVQVTLTEMVLVEADDYAEACKVAQVQTRLNDERFLQPEWQSGDVEFDAVRSTRDSHPIPDDERPDEI